MAVKKFTTQIVYSSSHELVLNDKFGFSDKSDSTEVSCSSDEGGAKTFRFTTKLKTRKFSYLRHL